MKMILASLFLILTLLANVSADVMGDWTKEPHDVFPIKRSHHKMVCIGDNRALLFGGYDGGNTYYNGTWVFQRSNEPDRPGIWVKKEPETAPPGRIWHAMAYLGKNAQGQDRVLLFGGQINNTTLEDTWIYELGAEPDDQGTWTEKKPSGDLPGKQSQAAMAYIDQDKALLFARSNTWIYELGDEPNDQGTWTEKAPSGNLPPMRQKHALTYLGGNRVLLFGGYVNEGGANRNDTYVYDINADSWTRKEPLEPLPEARNVHALAYLGGDIALLFGGHVGSKSVGDTWIYDLSDNEWRQHANPTHPSAREGHALTETNMSGLGHPVLFGGKAGGTDDETWLFKVQNQPPVADAGRDITVAEGAPVILAGTGSHDSDPWDVIPDAQGNPTYSLTYNWEQVAGVEVELEAPDTATTSFITPNVDADEGLTFRLTVADLEGLSHVDEVNVTIRRIDVYYVHPEGNDGDEPLSGGELPGSEDNPWKTISHAVENQYVSPGDTIKVMDDNDETTDDYVENISVRTRLTIERYDEVAPNPQIKSKSGSIVFWVTADGVTIRGLDIHGAGGTGGGLSGIYLPNVSGCIIQENRCGWAPEYKNDIGILLASSTNNIIIGNTCSHNISDGINLGEYDNIVWGNVCETNGNAGILLPPVSDDATTGHTLTDNLCENNRLGILIASSGNNVSANNCLNNDYGIYLDAGISNNTISGNTCGANDYGINVEKSLSTENYIYLNNFNGNPNSVESPSLNHWFSPTKLSYLYRSTNQPQKRVIGNHYSPYTGADADGDGIGDTPYISDGITDNNPLMEPPYNYIIQTWWLGNPLTDHEETPELIMNYGDLSQPGGTITINNNSHQTWCANQAAPEDILLSAGDQGEGTTWTGQITFASPPINMDELAVKIGFASDQSGLDFSPVGPEASIRGDGFETAFTFATEAVPFTLPQGKYLAIRVTNGGNSPYGIRVGGSWSYCSAAQGQLVSVVYVSREGNNGDESPSGDGSKANPWRTISYAVSHVFPGYTIKVTADDDEVTDDYIDNIIVDKPLTIEGESNTGVNPQVKSADGGHVFEVKADSVTIKGLDIYDAGTGVISPSGIYLNQVNGCTIVDNRCGLDISQYNIMRRNHHGIYLSGGGNNAISGNTCLSDSIGIHLSATTNNRVVDNILRKPIKLHTSSRNKILGNRCEYVGLIHSSTNTISGNTCPISLSGSNDNTVSGNTCFSGHAGRIGIILDSSNGNTITDNDCDGNDEHSIRLSGCDNNNIAGNECSNNGDTGIHLSSSSRANTISGNTCRANTFGIVVAGSGSNNDNTLYLNDLSGNTSAAAVDYAANTWYSPTKLGYLYGNQGYKNYLGNYYGDDNGARLDTEKDGLGDNPHEGVGMTDNSPLVAAPDNYALQTWWLANPIMYRGEMSKSGDIVTLESGANLIWLTDDLVENIFIAGNPLEETTWTGQITFASAPASGEEFTIEIGYADNQNGDGFWADGPEKIVEGDDVKTTLNFVTTAVALTVPETKYLAMRITNNSASPYDLRVGGSWSYCSAAQENVASVVYVSPSGHNGDESPPGGGSDEYPWRTIGYAISRVNAGATIKVMDDDNASTDDYLERCNIDKKLTLERYNTIGPNPQVKSKSGMDSVFHVTADGVTIRGLDIYGASGWAGIYLVGVSDCIIEDNRCGWDNNHNNGYGIKLRDASQNTISGNSCNANEDYGIEVYASSDNVIFGNTCKSNDGAGIAIHSSNYTAFNNMVSDNTCSNNEANGIRLHKANNTVVSGNTCQFNSAGIYLSLSNDNFVAGNNFSDNSSGIALSGSGNNTIYLNNFSSDTPAKVYEDSTPNTWHAPTRLGYFYADQLRQNYLGNYYGYYPDGNGDGIGDSTYTGEGMADEYPLIKSPDNYDTVAWWLGNPVMYLGDMSKPGATVNVSAGLPQIWTADQWDEGAFTSDGPLKWVNWTGQITFATAPAAGDEFAVEMGYADDPAGNNFWSDGVGATIVGGDNKTTFTFITNAAPFDVPADKHLALQITSGADNDLRVGGAWSYCTAMQVTIVANDVWVESEITFGGSVPPEVDIDGAIIFSVNVEDKRPDGQEDPAYGQEDPAYTDITIDVGGLDVNSCQIYKEGDKLQRVDGVGDLGGESTPPKFSIDEANNTVTIRLYVGDPTFAIVSPPREQPGLMYEASLQEGVNLVSVPLDPEDDWRLSDLAHHIGSALTYIVWYDSETRRFVSYFPDFPADSPANKRVEGADGYIIVMSSATVVIFTGKGWSTTTPGAPALHSAGTPVFVVDGLLLDDATSRRLNGLKVVIKNGRTGGTVEDFTGASGVPGRYIIPFASLTGKLVAKEGDTLVMSVFDQHGNAMIESTAHCLTADDLKANRLALKPLWVGQIPQVSALWQNYPNPFNPETWIPFELAKEAEVSLRIYNIKGEIVRTINWGNKKAGIYTRKNKALHWNGRTQTGEPVASGIYFYTFQAGEFTATRRMLILK